MLPIISIVLPVFGLIGLGFGARATKYVGDRTGDGPGRGRAALTG